MNSQHVNRFLRRWARLIALGATAAGVLTLVVSLLIPPVYESSTSLLVTSGGVSSTSRSSYDYLMASQQLTRTYAELLRKRPLLEATIANLQLNTTPEKLFNVVKVEPVPQSQIIVVRVQDSDAQRAANITNELVNLLNQQDRELLSAGAIPVGQGARVVEAATPSTIPVSPRPLRNTILALVFGAFLMIGVAFIKESLDDTIRSPEEAEAVVGAATLGSIGHIAGAGQPGGLVAVNAGQSAQTIAYRLLQARVEMALGDEPPHALLVTSSGQLEGKSTTVSNLAVALVRSGKRVILVDANLRRPSLHTIFDLTNGRGLTTALQDPAAAISCLISTSVNDLWLVPSGPLPPNPAELLRPQCLAALIAEWKKHADYVLFDTPALLAVADTNTIARHCDAAVLVVRAGSSRTEAVRTAQAVLAQTRIPLLGAVLNDASEVESIAGGGYLEASPTSKQASRSAKPAEPAGVSRA